jgi:hypothetical protein
VQKPATRETVDVGTVSAAREANRRLEDLYPSPALNRKVDASAPSADTRNTKRKASRGTTALQSTAKAASNTTSRSKAKATKPVEEREGNITTRSAKAPPVVVATRSGRAGVMRRGQKDSTGRRR